MIKMLGLTLVLLLGGSPALAGGSRSSVPAFDIKATCRILTKDTQENEENCLAEENAALAQLKQAWTSFGAGSRDECISLVTRSTLLSYLTLQDCLQTSQEAQSLSKQNRTKSP